jgi:hypothetical protein
MPDKPDNLIATFQYAGRAPLTMARIERPGLQVRVRSKKYEEACNTIEQIEKELRQIGDEFNNKLNAGVEINGSFYLRICNVQSAYSMGKDTKGRYEFVQNYYIDRRMT